MGKWNLWGIFEVGLREAICNIYHVSFFFLKNKKRIYLTPKKEWQKGTERKEFFCSLDHFPKDYNSHFWTKSKLGARYSTWDFNAGGRKVQALGLFPPHFPRNIDRKLDEKGVVGDSSWLSDTGCQCDKQRLPVRWIGWVWSESCPSLEHGFWRALSSK